MSSTFDQIANIIAETCDIPRDTIKPTTEQYFVLQNLADRIDELVAAKNAAPGA